MNEPSLGGHVISMHVLHYAMHYIEKCDMTEHCAYQKPCFCACCACTHAKLISRGNEWYPNVGVCNDKSMFFLPTEI